MPFLRRVVERLQSYPESSIRQVQLVEVDGELYICRDQEEVQRATGWQLAWSVMALGEAAKGARRKGGGVVVLKGKIPKPGSRGG